MTCQERKKKKKRKKKKVYKFDDIIGVVNKEFKNRLVFAGVPKMTAFWHLLKFSFVWYKLPVF